MSLLCKKGSFSVTSGVGSTQDVTDVGFQPLAVVMWCTLDTQTAQGFAAGQCISVGIADGSNSSEASGGYQNANPTVATSQGSGTIVTQAGHGGSSNTLVLNAVTFLSNGFRFTVNTNTGANATLVHYLALGGTDITNAILATTTPRSVAGTQTVTGVGFQGDAIIMLYEDGSPFFTMSIGAAVSSSKRWASAVSGVNGATCTAASLYKCYQRTDSIILGMDNTGIESARADFTGFTSDGFTLNWVTAASGNVMYYLVLKTGGQVDVGSLAKSTAGAPVTDTITPSINSTTPAGILLCTFQNAATTSIVNNSTIAFGGGDGTNEGHIWGGALNGNITANTASARFTTAKAIGAATLASGSQPSSAVFEADHALTGTTATLTWTTNDATSEQILWMIFGSKAAAANTDPPFGANVLSQPSSHYNPTIVSYQ